MKKLKEIYGYIEHFSKLQAVVAFCAGAGTTYYMSLSLLPILGNTASYVLGASSGTFVGLVTVYGAERDIQKFLNEKKASNRALRKECHELQVSYLKNKGKHQTLDLHQISDQNIQKIFLLLQVITAKISRAESITATDLEIKPLLRRVATWSALTGRATGRPTDEAEDIILDINVEETNIDHSSDAAFLRKVWQFLCESKLTAKVIILSNLAMSSYYMQYALTEGAGIENQISWPISIVLGCLASPIITYATAEPARHELTRLTQEHAFLEDAQIKLSLENSRLDQNLSEMEQLIVSPQEHKKLAKTISKAQPSTINAGFLSESFKQFNESAKTKGQRQPKQSEIKTARAGNMLYQTADLKKIVVTASPSMPLLKDLRDNFSSNTSLNSSDRPVSLRNLAGAEDDATSQQASAPWRCAIL